MPYYTEDPVPTWYYHTAGDDVVHRGPSSECPRCKNKKKVVKKDKPVPKPVKKGKCAMTNCAICNKKIQGNSTGLCGECYNEVRYVARMNHGPGTDKPPTHCRNKGCEAELKEGNKSGYCGDCYNKVSKYLSFLRKGTTPLRSFGIVG